MTREEVTIQALRNHIEVLEENIRALEKEVKMRDATLEERKSVDEYIKSISTTTRVDFWDLEPCEDCISRKAALDMSDFVGEMPTLDKPYDELEEVVHVEDIKALPSVTPVRKKGKWKNGDPICHCCGEDKFKDLDADIWADWQPKYCPNCGSFMEVKR